MLKYLYKISTLQIFLFMAKLKQIDRQHSNKTAVLSSRAIKQAIQYANLRIKKRLLALNFQIIQQKTGCSMINPI